MMWLFALIGLVILAVILFFFFRPRRPRLSSASRERLRNEWQRACAHADLHRKLLDADSVISRLLKTLGYEGPMGEQLKAAQRYIPGIDAVWSAHKLRNQIAHEPGMGLFPGRMEQAMRAFERVIEKFC